MGLTLQAAPFVDPVTLLALASWKLNPNPPNPKHTPKKAPELMRLAGYFYLKHSYAPELFEARTGTWGFEEGFELFEGFRSCFQDLCCGFGLRVEDARNTDVKYGTSTRSSPYEARSPTIQTLDAKAPKPLNAQTSAWV